MVPRTDDELSATVPASQTALHEVGRWVCPEQVPLHDLDALEGGVDHGQARLARMCCTFRTGQTTMSGNRFVALAGTETVAMPQDHSEGLDTRGWGPSRAVQMIPC